MPIYDRRRARRSIFDTIAYRAASQVATVLGYIVLVRAMPKQDFGIFNLLYSFIPVVTTVASLGLEQVLRRYQPEFIRAGRPNTAAWLFKFVSSARLISNVLILSVLLLVWNYIAPLFGLTAYRAMFGFFSVLILLFFQTYLLQLALAAHMLHRFSVGSVALLSLTKLIVYAALAWRGLLSLRTAILADTLAYAVAFLFLRYVYRQRCLPDADSKELVRPDAKERKRLISYGLLNNFNDAGTLFLDTRTDNFFIAAFIDPISVGVYAFYTRLNEMANNLLPARLFENVVQPMFFSLPRSEAQQRIPAYFTFLLNMNLVLQWPVLAFATAYHAELVRVLFGGKFIDHSWLLPLIVGLATVNIISSPVTLVAQYEEKAGIILFSKIFGICNVLAMIVLIPVAGLYGAALASGSSQAVKNLFIWWHVRKLAHWNNAVASLLSCLALWGTTAALCIAINKVWTAPAVVRLMLGVAICLAAAMVHVRGAAITGADRKLLASLFQGKEARLLRYTGLLRYSDSGKLATDAPMTS
jgi:O-antigen/teichoic acid export membrane protein